MPLAMKWGWVWATQGAARADLPRPQRRQSCLAKEEAEAHASGWLGRRLTDAGRVAFTNYLGTTVVMVLIFHGFAGGLFGELTRGQLYLVMLTGWAAMLTWPGWWLARYRYGPLEWLWRCLTYWQRFPPRR